MNTYAQQYHQQHVQTASPEQLLLMLYDGAIRFLKIARKGFEEQNIEKLHNNLLKTQHIITELMTSLDMEIGGEVAKNLYALYDYLYYRLVQANIKRDVTMVDEVLGHLESLRATWDEAIRIAAREAAQEQQAANPAAVSPGERSSDDIPESGQSRVYNV